MGKKRIAVNVLTATAVSGLITAALSNVAYAQVDTLVVKDTQANKNFEYKYGELKDSLKDNMLNPDKGQLYKDFVDLQEKYGTYAFHDDVRNGYVSYTSITDALKDSMIHEEEFDLDNFTEKSEKAEVVTPENLGEKVIENGKVIVKPVKEQLVVESVSAINATSVEVTLAEKPAVAPVAEKFEVKANGTDVKVEKLEKVASDLKGKTYKLTIASLDKNEGKLTVNGVEKAFDFKAPEVKGIEVKDATHIVINFNEELNEDSIVEARFNIKKVTGNVSEPAAKVVLNADKRSVTVTLSTALVPADYVLSLGTVAVQDGAAAKHVEDAAKNGIYAGTEVSFRPTSAQLENKVAPTLAKATYNKGTGLLSLTFDKSITDSKLDVTKLSINGVALTAADTVDTTTADDNHVEIKLGEVSKKAVNALEGEFKLTAAKDAYGVADKLTDGETFAIAKEEPAVVKSSAYNQETNVLTVTFDKAVTLEAVNILSIDDADQADSAVITKAMAKDAKGTDLDATKASAIWTFDCTGTQATKIEAMTVANLKAYILKDAVKNEAKVLNVEGQETYEKGVKVEYTKDAAKPFITGVEFNNLTNELTVKLSEKATLADDSKIVIDTDEDVAVKVEIAQAKFTEPGIAKDTFVASLKGGQHGADVATIKALNDLYATGKDLKLTVAKKVITDTNKLENDVVDFAHGINVVFHDYVKPSITDGTSESSTKAKVIFNEKVDKITAETVANYIITDTTGVALSVTAAQLQADGVTVYLTTATQTSGKPYYVTIANVKDLQGNIMDVFKTEDPILGNGDVKDTKLEVSGLVATAVQNDKDTLKVTFLQDVDQVLATNIANYAVLAKGKDAKYADAKAVSLVGATVKIDATNAKSVIITLADGVNIINTNEYKVIVNNVKDIYGNELDTTKVEKKANAIGDSELKAPKVIINHLDGEKNDIVTLVFSEQLNADTVVKENFKVNGTAATGVATSWNAEKKEYTVTLQTGADFTEAKAVAIDAKVVDLAGNTLTNATIAAGDVTLKDSVKPTVSGVEAKAISDSKDTIEVTFDKDVVEASAKVLANYTLTDESGKVIDLKDAEVELEDKVATITLPDGTGDSKNEVNLLNGKNYTVTVENVVDIKGNAMDKVTKTVTWAADSDATVPTYTIAAETGKSTVTLKFNEKVDLSKVDLSTFTINYDADKDDANNDLTKLSPIYVAKADDSMTITITLDNNVSAAAAGKTAIVITEINEGKEVYDLAGNKAAHDAVDGNDMATAAEEATYTVTFDSKDGSAVAPIEDVAEDATVTLPTAPTKDGFTFGGWFTNEELTNEFTSSTQVTADITVYAKWTAEETTYTVTFDSKDGSAVAPIEDVAEDATVTLPTAPTKDGFTFGGWFTNEELTNEFTSSTQVTADITVYAKWTV